MASVEELLRDAALGRLGVDRRLIRGILESQDAEPAFDAVLRFAREPQDDHRIDIDPLLTDLLRHFQTYKALSPHALEFYIEFIRRSPDDVSDDLVQAILPFGAAAVDPLLKLYEELGEEQGADVAFLLAGLRVRDERVLAMLLDRLEFDTADGAFALGLYGDPAAREPLEKMLAEIPEEDAELRREVAHAIEQLDAPEPRYEPEPFDIFADYRERELPIFDVLPEAERLELLRSDDALVRAGAAHSFFNSELNVKSRAALLEVAKSDADALARGKAWESLADATEDAAVRDAMVAVLNDAARPIEERGGAAVGLYGVGDRDEVRRAIEALYAEGGPARVKALEAMWRSLWEPYAKFFPGHLEEKDPKLVKEALRGAGYFRLTRYADKIAAYFDREEPFDDLREDALFAYALAMPGETTRGRVRGMLRKIDSITPLSGFETQLVEFGLDERLRLHGLEPVFSAESGEEEVEPVAAAPPPEPAGKIGRNDPCPCGSGKKYKKCHGA
ncbi:MAG TPA: SEC-C metal-binding domain-containing protein [Bryobacteraceae bacterium]|nr:SEC-C metal-binding domain-containing protein [Bryobacteraceae bacterium]